jgi:hypothetical protein
MPKSLKSSSTKNSPKIHICLRTRQNDLCDFYKKVNYKKFFKYIYQQETYNCWSKQALKLLIYFIDNFLKEDQKQKNIYVL